MKISIYLLFSASVRVDFKSYWDFRNSWFCPSHCILLYVNINNWDQFTSFILINSDKLVHNPLMLRSLKKDDCVGFWFGRMNGIIKRMKLHSLYCNSLFSSEYQQSHTLRPPNINGLWTSLSELIKVEIIY